MDRFSETHGRSITKTISWRVVATLVTLGVLYAYTGKFFISLTITLTAAALSTIAYYIHERTWNTIQWGRAKKKGLI